MPTHFAIMSLMNKEIKRVAIVRLSALGDIVNSAIVLQFIKQKYKNVTIEWITEEAFLPLLLKNSSVNRVHSINLKKIKKEKNLDLLKQTITKLKSLDEFDIIIDMQGLIKSAIVSKFIGKKTHGFDRKSTRESLASLFYKSSSKIPYETSVVKRNCFVVADALGFEIDDEMILNKKPIFKITKKFKLQKEKKNIAFVIGASWKSKIYPKEKIVEVCNALKQKCHIIWGSEQEKKNAEWICKNSEFATLAPSLNLSELVSFISHMDLLIGNDTGPTHMAWAQNISSITLFGPTNLRMIYETPTNIGIESPSKVNILKINKNDFSIQEIPSQTLIEKAKELLYGL